MELSFKQGNPDVWNGKGNFAPKAHQFASLVSISLIEPGNNEFVQQVLSFRRGKIFSFKYHDSWITGSDDKIHTAHLLKILSLLDTSSLLSFSVRGSAPLEEVVAGVIAAEENTFRRLKTIEFPVSHPMQQVWFLSRKTGALESIGLGIYKQTDIKFPPPLLELMGANPSLAGMSFDLFARPAEFFGVRFTGTMTEFASAIPDAFRKITSLLPSYRSVKVSHRTPVDCAMAILGAARADKAFVAHHRADFLSAEEKCTLLWFSRGDMGRENEIGSSAEPIRFRLSALQQLIAEFRSLNPEFKSTPYYFIRAAAYLVTHCDALRNHVPAEGAVRREAISLLGALLGERLDSVSSDASPFLDAVFRLGEDFFGALVPLLQSDWILQVRRMDAIVNQLFKCGQFGGVTTYPSFPTEFVKTLASHPRFDPFVPCYWDTSRGTIGKFLLFSLLHNSYVIEKEDVKAAVALLGGLLCMRGEKMFLMPKAVLLKLVCSKVDLLPTAAALVELRQLNTGSVARHMFGFYGSFEQFRQLVALSCTGSKTGALPKEVLQEFVRTVWVAAGTTHLVAIRAGPRPPESVFTSALKHTAGAAGMEMSSSLVLLWTAQHLTEVLNTGKRRPDFFGRLRVFLTSVVERCSAPFSSCNDPELSRLISRTLEALICAILTQFSTAMKEEWMQQLLLTKLLPLVDMQHFMAVAAPQETISAWFNNFNTYNVENLWTTFADACSAGQLQALIRNFAELGKPNCLCAHYCKALLKRITAGQNS